jgi:hypothetical protein
MITAGRARELISTSHQDKMGRLMDSFSTRIEEVAREGGAYIKFAVPFRELNEIKDAFKQNGFCTGVATSVNDGAYYLLVSWKGDNEE